MCQDKFVTASKIIMRHFFYLKLRSLFYTSWKFLERVKLKDLKQSDVSLRRGQYLQARK